MKQNAVQTANIKEVLRQFASDSYTPLDACDFTLYGVLTYFRTCNMDTFAKYGERFKELYADKEKIINDRVVFRQVYKILPHKKQECVMNLEYTIDHGPYDAQPQLIVHPSSAIPYARYKPQEMLTLLVREINKIKAYEGMLIGMFSEAMIEDVKKLVKKLYLKQFTGDVPILLFNGIEPELARPGKLTLHFAEKNLDRQLKEVEVGELIVEYLKPIFGHHGLNAFGRRISRGDTTNEEFLSCTIDSQTIDVIENDDKILLYSKKRGFVHYNSERIEISNKVTLQNVKRVQSQVAKEEQNEVEVVVSQNDITKDSVGEGVHLTSETIHISGHIADKAKLEARTLIIDGATHTGSSLFAHEATINRHKGVLRCHKATIKLLEGGEVHASYVHIDAALGGTVYADHVTLGTVKHHLKVYATQSITVEEVRGEDNKFVIDYRQIPIIKSRLEYIEEDIDELRYHLDEAKRFREQDVPKISKKIVALREEADTIKESSFHATVTLKNRQVGLNTITFALPKKKEITYKTREGMKYEPFRLERNADEDEVTLHPVGVTISL